jgi:hypothetical protein
MATTLPFVRLQIAIETPEHCSRECQGFELSPYSLRRASCGLFGGQLKALPLQHSEVSVYQGFARSERCLAAEIKGAADDFLPGPGPETIW